MLRRGRERHRADGARRSYYHTGKSEGCAFFTAFPFGFTMGEMAGVDQARQRPEALGRAVCAVGIRGFNAGSTGTQMFGWFRREIRSLPT